MVECYTAQLLFKSFKNKHIQSAHQQYGHINKRHLRALLSEQGLQVHSKPLSQCTTCIILASAFRQQCFDAVVEEEALRGPSIGDQIAAALCHAFYLALKNDHPMTALAIVSVLLCEWIAREYRPWRRQLLADEPPTAWSEARSSETSASPGHSTSFTASLHAGDRRADLSANRRKGCSLPAPPSSSSFRSLVRLSRSQIKPHSEKWNDALLAILAP